MSQDGVSSFGEAVRQLLNVCAHTAKANYVMQKVCKGNLLGLEHGTKIAYIARSGRWGEKLYKSINAKGGLQASHHVVVGLLLASENDFTQALEALAGPHVSIIAAIKYNAHVITKTKSIKRGETTNDVLNSALRAVNCVNAIWYTMTHITDFLWDLARFIPEDVPARAQLLDLRKRLSTAIERADEFSTNARLKVAEECITTRLVIPSSKHYRGVTRETVLGAGPVLRSEVVFKHKCKTLKSISKHQPLRLSIFGNLVVLTVSKLSAETLAVPPYPLGSVTAQILPNLPDTVLRLQLGEKTSVTLRCKIAGHRDVWVNFFNGGGMDDYGNLVEKHEAFQEQLAQPAPPRLAQRPSMAELSLFNETRKATAPAAEAWGENDDDDDLETAEVELQFKGLGDMLDRGADTPSIGKRVVEHCSLPASRAGSPMVRGDNYTPTAATAAARGTSPSPIGRSATPPRMMAAPTARAAPSPLRAQAASPNITAPKPAAPHTGDTGSDADPELARALAESLVTHEQHKKQLHHREHRDLRKAISMSQWQTFDTTTASPSSSRPASTTSATARNARGTSPCNDPWTQPAWTKVGTTNTESPSGRSSATMTTAHTARSAGSSSTLAADVDPLHVSAPASAEEAATATVNMTSNTRPTPNSTHADKNAAKDDEADDAVVPRRVIPVRPIRQNSDAFGASFA